MSGAGGARRGYPAARSNDLLAGRVRPRGRRSGAWRWPRSSRAWGRSCRGCVATSVPSPRRLPPTSATARRARSGWRRAAAHRPRWTRLDRSGRGERRAAARHRRRAGRQRDASPARTAWTGPAVEPVRALPPRATSWPARRWSTRWSTPCRDRRLAGRPDGRRAACRRPGGRRSPRAPGGSAGRAPDRRRVRRQQRHPDRPARGRPHRSGARDDPHTRHPPAAVRETPGRRVPAAGGRWPTRCHASLRGSRLRLARCLRRRREPGGADVAGRQSHRSGGAGDSAAGSSSAAIR